MIEDRGTVTLTAFSVSVECLYRKIGTLREATGNGAYDSTGILRLSGLLR